MTSHTNVQTASSAFLRSYNGRCYPSPHPLTSSPSPSLHLQAEEIKPLILGPPGSQVEIGFVAADGGVNLGGFAPFRNRDTSDSSHDVVLVTLRCTFWGSRFWVHVDLG